MDKIDKAIINTLWKNSRTRDNEIAKRLNITPRTIAKHIKQLGNNGLEHTIAIDFQTLGLIDTICIKIKLDKKQHIDYRHLKDYIQSIAGIYFAAFSKGDFDIMLLVATRRMDDYEKLIDNLRINIPYEKTVSHFLLKNYTGFIPPSRELFDTASIEYKDKFILKHLQHNSRITFSEMAKELGISVPALISRFEKLKNIVGCRSAIMTSDNINVFAEFISCKYKSNEELGKIIDFLQAHGNNVHGISGEFDLLSLRVFRSSREYYSFLDDMDRSIGTYITSKEDAELTIIKGRLPIQPRFAHFL